VARKRPITAFGWAIKMKLAELQMDQREFCERNGIPENRLGDIITGSRKASKQRDAIIKALGLDDFAEAQ